MGRVRRRIFARSDWYTINGNRKLWDVAGHGPVVGTFYALDAFLLVYNNKVGENVNQLRQFELEILLDHPRIGNYFGLKVEGDYTVLAFERSANSVMSFNFGVKSFSHTQKILSQIIKAIIYVHSIGYIHRALHRPESYVFYENQSTVSVKITSQDCFRIGSEEAYGHSKSSNIEDFSRFACLFFFGPHAEPGVVRIYNPEINHPPVRFVPSFESRRAYVLEVIDFIKSAATTLLPSLETRDGSPVPTVPPNARDLQDHPLMWASERRLKFYQYAYEVCKESKAGDDILNAIDNLPEFHENVGPGLMNLALEVRADLRAPKSPTVPSSPADKQGDDISPIRQRGACPSTYAMQHRDGQGAGPSSSGMQRAGLKSCMHHRSRSTAYRQHGDGQPHRKRALRGVGKAVPNTYRLRGAGQWKRAAKQHSKRAGKKLWKGAEKLRGTTVSVTDFLRLLRNFIAHGLPRRSFSETKSSSYYEKYDKEATKGFDLYLALNFPYFFLHIFRVIRKFRDGHKENSLEN